MSATTEMNSVIETAPVVEKKDMRKGPNNWRNRPLKAAAPVEKEATPPASDDEAEKSDVEEAPAPAPPAKKPSISIPLAEFNRLRAIEKEYNEMKAKYDEMVAKETALKAKRNEASKKSKAKKTKEVKEVKAKLEQRVEALEKLVIKPEAEAEDDAEEEEASDAEAEE
jgi:hypothetical protein